MPNTLSGTKSLVTRPNVARRLLVLGATGLVGRAVCQAAAVQGYLVHGVARSPRGPQLDGIGYTALDVLDDTDAFVELLDDVRPHIVVNSVGALWTNDLTVLERGNITAIEVVIEALRRMHGRPRLVHVGSIYECAPNPGETLPAYVRTKLAGSERVLAANERGDIDATVLRISTVVGAGVSASSSLGAVAAMLMSARRFGERNPVQLTATVSARDYLDVHDAASAVLRGAVADVLGRALPVGSGRLVDLRTTLEMLAAVAGVPAEVELQGQPGGGWTYPPADLDITSPALVWAPKYDLSDSLTDLWCELAATPPAGLHRSLRRGRQASSDLTAKRAA